MVEHPIIDWLTDVSTCFLLGAGCSKCAGKPLITELSTKVLMGVGKQVESLYGKLVGFGGREPTVEDLLTQLLQIRRLLVARKIQEDGEWNVGCVEDAITTTTKAIVKQIGAEWKSSPIHERFLQRLAGHSARKTCDIFSLNYDVVMESSLEQLCFAYTDGFRGGENAYFDPSMYDVDSRPGTLFRYYKLHGSVNWFRDANGVVRRRPAQNESGTEPHIIYPSEQKYFQSQYGVYETLLSRFRDRLRERTPNNKLVILGYSLSDEHIVEAIIDSVCSPQSNLTVYALLGAEPDPNIQTARLQALVDRCHNRFNVMVGRHAFLGSALESGEWDAIKAMDLWKYENLVGLLTGVLP